VKPDPGSPRPGGRYAAVVTDTSGPTSAAPDHRAGPSSAVVAQDLLDEVALAVGEALAGHGRGPVDWRERGGRPGQYRLDLVADAAALEVLRGAGVGILSEESGLESADAGVVVVVDPVDGSTNASRGLPWFATSLCAVDGDGPLAALVVNLATGTRWSATRGGGATRDGVPIRPSGVTALGDAVVILNGYAGEHVGWKQYRALGATALDICAVADGSVDATLDCTVDALGPWDYLGAALVLTEAGGRIEDVEGRPLLQLDHRARRTPVSAGTAELFDAVLAARRGLPPGRPSRRAAGRR
jgi:myo-inositol-1(or 4)-monophosphatase